MEDEYVYFDFKIFLKEFKRNIKKITIFIILFVLLTLLVLFLMPNEYESSVILSRTYSIYVPEVSKNLSMYKSMEFYKNYVLSKGVLSKVEDRAIHLGILKEKGDFSCSAELFYKPISAKMKVDALKLTVRYKDPYVASKLVNLWAKVVMENMSKMGGEVFSDAKSTINTYESEMEKINKLKEEKVKITKEYTFNIDSESAKWDKKINLFEAKYPIELWNDEVASFEDEIVTLQGESGDIGKKISELKLRLKMENLQLKKISKNLNVNINLDDKGVLAIIKLMKNKKGALKGLSDLNIQIEKLNPAYIEMLTNYGSDIVELNGLESRLNFIKERIKDLKEVVGNKKREIALKKSILDNIVTQKSTIISKLKKEMAEKLGEMDIKINLIKGGLTDIENIYLISKKIEKSGFKELSVSLWGVPNEKKAFPPRLLITIISFIFALFASFVFIFFKVLFRE